MSTILRRGPLKMAELKNRILREIGAIARCIQATSDIKYRQISLHRGQFIFLARVCEHPGINLIDLSHMLKVDKTTATKAVAKLASAGYLARERDAADKRIWHLFPTAKALEIYPRIIAEENRSLDAGLAGFTPEEEAAMGTLLHRMRINLEKEWHSMKIPGGGRNHE